MVYVFNKSARGYQHKSDDIPCQDFSASYVDNDRIIITCADGHGGKIYLRSQDGSKVSSNAALFVLSNISSFDVSRGSQEILNRIKLEILCEWNAMVEALLAARPIRKSETINLTPDQIDSIKENKSRVYGSTLTGALVFKNKLLVIGIGDTEVIGFKDGEIRKLIADESAPVGNITYSMCQEDAYDHINVAMYDWKDFDGVLLCTDGLTSPYQSYKNFEKGFLRPTVRQILKTKSLSFLNNNIDMIANKLGTGDDVSLSLILKGTARMKYYK